MAKPFTISAAPLPAARKIAGRLQGKVLLVVNTASKCGFTPSLPAWRNCTSPARTRALRSWASPQPVRQAGSGQQRRDHGVLPAQLRREFPHVRQDRGQRQRRRPLFKHLKKAAPGALGTEGIKWNFTKFLIDTDGNVVKRYAPTDKPKAIEKDVKSSWRRWLFPIGLRPGQPPG